MEDTTDETPQSRNAHRVRSETGSERIQVRPPHRFRTPDGGREHHRIRANDPAPPVSRIALQDEWKITVATRSSVERSAGIQPDYGIGTESDAERMRVGELGRTGTELSISWFWGPGGSYARAGDHLTQARCSGREFTLVAERSTPRSRTRPTGGIRNSAGPRTLRGANGVP